MSHFVYMLRCAGDRIYTGYAVDVEARFEQHKSGRGAKFTKAFPPECILRKFELNCHEEALRLEARIKKLPRSQKEPWPRNCSQVSAKPLKNAAPANAAKNGRKRMRLAPTSKRVCFVIPYLTRNILFNLD